MKRSGFIILLLIAFTSKSQSSLDLFPSKDTYINSVIADQVQGQVQSLIASGWTYGGTEGVGRSLIGFELCDLPADFTLVSATLHLSYDYSSNHAGSTTNGTSAKLYKITGSWTENTTWASQPTFDINTFVLVPGANVSNQNYVLNVTNFVNNCLLNSTELGFYLKLDNETHYRSLVLASSEHPDVSVRPKLVLVFNTVEDWCGGISNTDTVGFDCFENLIIPNVFTPNSDQNNDIFVIKSSCEFDEFHIEILNRWGNKVFESAQQDFIWSGLEFNSQLSCKEGTYFYKITSHKEGKDYQKYGFVQLVR